MSFLANGEIVNRHSYEGKTTLPDGGGVSDCVH